MKCKICGGESFIAHQVCHMDVLVDEDGCFIDNVENGIYDSARPFGPFTCTRCGAVYDELDEETMTDGPEENWEEKNALYKKVQDRRTTGDSGRFQHWSGKYYQVYIAFGDNGFRYMNIANTREGYGFPSLKVEANDAGDDRVIIQPDSGENMDIDKYRQHLRQLKTALEAARQIEDLFVLPIQDGTFDMDAKFIYGC